jgi:hypothetical protein
LQVLLGHSGRLEKEPRVEEDGVDARELLGQL